jgi:hypothetical protein
MIACRKPLERVSLLCLLALLACGGSPSEQPAAVPADPGASATPTAPPPAAPADAPAPPAAEPESADAPREPAGAAHDQADEATPSAAKTPAQGSAAKAEPSAAAPTAPAQAAGPCGEEGQRRCPLQAFMEDEVDKPLESGDLEHVAASLTKVAKMAPEPSWNANGANGFRGMAEASAAAARANDVPALQQSCKSCHKAFRRQYKEQYRPRPLP